jgi:RimJ/RimL family protein N-acetyltransferase
VSFWPLFDLRVRTPRLELRLPHDEELAALAAVARGGIHDPDEMPFLVPWTRAESPAFERGFLQFHWRMRGSWEPDAWDLPLGVYLDGEPIGSQSLGAEHFGLLRLVNTGSWLARSHQGRGFGKEMRAGVLELAFAGLGADLAMSEALDGNAASVGVSTSLGYEPNGTGRVAVEGRARTVTRFLMERERWLARRPFTAEIEGLEPCLELFGAAAVAEAAEA